MKATLQTHQSSSTWSMFWKGWMDKAFLKEISSVAFPILISNTINTCLQLIDQLMLASLGTKTLVAISYVNLIYFFTGIIFFGIGSASAIFFSRLFAQKNMHQINQVKAIAISIGWIFSILTIILAEFFPHQILSLYTTDQEVINIGTVFFHNIAYGQPFFAVAGVYIYILRVIGQGTAAMMGSIIAFTTNTVLNYILIFGHFGAPALGVLGAAIATNCARIFMMIYYIIRIQRTAPSLQLRVQNFLHMPPKLIWVVCKSTFFLITADSLWAITLNLYSSIFGHMGVEASAAYSITLMFRQLTIMIPFAMTPAILIIIGQHIGSGESNRSIRQMAVKCQAFGFVFSIIIAGCLSFLSPFILKTFYSNIPMNILHNTKYMIIILAWLLPLMTANNFFGAGIFRAGGNTKINLNFIIIFNVCLSLPLCYYFGIHKYGMVLVFLMTYIGDIFRFVAQVLYFIYGKWIVRIRVQETKETLSVDKIL